MNTATLDTIVHGVGWTLLHFVWEGLVIGGTLALLLRFLRRNSAQSRYLVACAALALMAAAPLITFRIVQQNRLPVAIAAAAPVSTSVATLPQANSETPAPVEISTPTIVSVAAPEIPPSPSANSPVAVDARRLKSNPPSTPVAADLKRLKFNLLSHFRDGSLPRKLDRCLPWLVTAWLAGVLLLSSRLATGWWQIHRVKNSAAQSPVPDWETKLAELAQRLGIRRTVRLLQSAFVEVPTVIGWLRPVILLPASCLTGLTPAQLEAILAHELAHIRRHDYLINLLQSAVETLLFYHPIVWWTSRKLREEREHCCDDLAVAVSGDRAGYARALATLEELRPAPAQLALSAAGPSLLQRIRRLAGRPETAATRPAWPFTAFVLVLVLLLAGATLRQHRAAAAESPSQTNSLAKGAAAAAPQTNSPSTAGLVQLRMMFVAVPHADWKWSPSNASPVPDTTNNGPVLRVEKTINNTEYHAILDALNMTEGSEVLATPESTTKSGNTVEFHTESISTLAWTNNSAAAYVVDPWTLNNRSATNHFCLIFDQGITPTVLADYRSIALTLTPEIANDAGHGKLQPAAVFPTPASAIPPGATITAVLPLPHWTHVYPLAATNVTLIDGQTVILGGFTIPAYTNYPAESKSRPTPIFAPYPRDLKIFVTATLVNADGTRYHSDNEKESSASDAAALPPGNGAAPTTTAMAQVAQAWDVPGRVRKIEFTGANPYSHQSNVVNTNPGRKIVFDKLNRILVESINYTNVPLQDVLNDLHARSAAGDPDGTGINFFTLREPETSNPYRNIDPGSARITLSLGNVSLAQVLDGVLKSAERPLQFSVFDYGIGVSLRNPDPPTLEIRNFVVDPAGFRSEIIGVLAEPTNTSEVVTQVRDHFAKMGVDLSTNSGKAVIWNSRKNMLTFKATAEDLDLIEKALPLKRLGFADVPGSSSQATAASQTLSSDQYQSVVQAVPARAAELSAAANTIPSAAPGLRTVEPDLPLSSSPPVAPAVDVIEQAWKATNRVAIDASNLIVTRTFRVDNNRFLSALGQNLGTNFWPPASAGTPRNGSSPMVHVTGGGAGVPGGFGGSNPPVRQPPSHEVIESAIRDYFKGSGVDLSPEHGRAIVYNVSGELTVRATLFELETIGQAVDSLNQVLPQVNIKTRFIEITQNDNRTFGFQWQPGGIVVGTNGPVTKGASTPQLAGAPQTASPLGVFPGQTNTPRGWTNATITGILTDPQFRATLQALEQRDGTQVLSAPEVTTESGRQAQLMIGNIQTIVLPPTNAGGIALTSNMFFGPEIDVLPYVDSLRSNITVAITPSISEFIGYDDPGQFRLTNGAVMPLPRFRLRQTTTTVTVHDGDTVAIGGLMSDETETVKTKRPILGSLPLIGSSFQSTQTVKRRKNLMIFVTATIVNPDGTRYNPANSPNH